MAGTRALLRLALAVAALAAASSLAWAQSEFATIDRHALNISAGDSATVTTLAAALTAPASNDAEKARAIFRWITANITYDDVGYVTGRYHDLSPEAVLRERRSVCEGFARLFEALARAAGLEVAHIPGHCKGLGYRLGLSQSKASHAWNAVKTDGKWQLLDVTWGSGAQIGAEWQRRFTEHYFLTSPEEFIYDHFPEDPKWQLLDPPLTWAEYDRLASLRSDFFRCGLKLDSHKQARITAENEVTISFTGPEGVQVLASLRSDIGAPLTGDWTLCQKADGKYQVLVRWPEPGKYRLTIFAKPRGQTGPAAEAAHYTIDASGAAPTQFPFLCSGFSDLGATLVSPTEAMLQAGRPCIFTVAVPRAKEVTVSLHGIPERLPRRGDQFTGAVTPTAGRVTLVADGEVLAVYEAR